MNFITWLFGGSSEKSYNNRDVKKFVSEENKYCYLMRISYNDNTFEWYHNDYWRLTNRLKYYDKKKLAEYLSRYDLPKNYLNEIIDLWKIEEAKKEIIRKRERKILKEFGGKQNNEKEK